MNKRIITTDVMEEDYKIENSLRPQLLEDYVGQKKAKENLDVYKRQELYGAVPKTREKM